MTLDHCPPGCKQCTIFSSFQILKTLSDQLTASEKLHNSQSLQYLLFGQLEPHMWTVMKPPSVIEKISRLFAISIANLTDGKRVDETRIILHRIEDRSVVGLKS